MRYFSHLFFITILCLCCSTIANAKTINVDKNGGGDFLTIQEGIDAASAGDTVVVGEGVYTGNFNLTKGLTLISNSPNHTIIDGVSIINNYNKRIVKFNNFTFKKCDFSINRITEINKCNLVNNRGTFIECNVEKCYFQENFGLYIINSTIKNCLFINGYGLWNKFDRLTIRNCCFYYKIECLVDISLFSNCNFENTIFWAIYNKNFKNFFNVGDQCCNFQYCNIMGSGSSGNWDKTLGINGGGNIDADPLFKNPNNFDFHLTGHSPCIDSGNPNDDYSNEPSPNGNRINMGAYGNTSEAYVKKGLSISPFFKKIPSSKGITIFYIEECINCRAETDDPWLSIIHNTKDIMEVEYTRNYGTARNGKISISEATGISLSVDILQCGIILVGENEEYTSIQDAINSSIDLDTIIVKKGEYEGFHSKINNYNNLKILSLDGPNQTNIKSSFVLEGRCFYVCAHLINTLIEGFTFINCGIDFGIGLDVRQQHVVNNCIFLNSSTGTDSISTITNSIFINNSKAIHNADTIQNCTFVGNNTAISQSETIINCILWNNETNINGTPTISYSNIQNSGGSSNWQLSATDGGGNIDQDPKFVSSTDFRLQPSSPCIDTGINISTLFSDLRGSLRTIDVNSTGNDKIHNNFDMGAYEFSADPGGSDDNVIKAFKDVKAEVSTLAINCPYFIKWKNRDPFPFDDNRISDEYTVQRVLVNETNGSQIPLDTLTVPSITQTEYSSPFTFSKEHIGSWRIRIELKDDPNQFEISDQVIGISDEPIHQWIIGQEISPPDSADPAFGNGPELEERYQNAFYWHVDLQKLYAVAPTTNGFARVKWFQSNGDPVYVLGDNLWPDDNSFQPHVASTPSVNLMTSSELSTAEIMFCENDATIDAGYFLANEAGRSVVMYLNNNVPCFEIVKTMLWNDPDHFSAVDWEIGTVITDPEHISACGNAYAFFPLTTYAVNESASQPYDGYDIEKRQGPIVFVHLDYTPDNTEDELLLSWYQQSATGACWPFKAIRYSPILPSSEIVIASMNGTGAQFAGMDNISVYNQPDKTKPGYNPNEEHAFLKDITIYPLREDLNRNDTSKPYIIVKYQNPGYNNQWEFKGFRVIAETSEYPFHYTGHVGNLVKPPTPISSECKESRSIEISDITWTDYNGENRHVRKPGTEIFHFFYPLQRSFYYDLDNDGIQDKPEGACVPWLDHRQGGTVGTPIDVTYTISWPPDAPTLNVGDTLFTLKNGLPEIRKQCCVEIIYDESVAKNQLPSVKLLEVMSESRVTLNKLPPEIRTQEFGQQTVVFPDLPPHLIDRLFYNYSDNKLIFKGKYYDPTEENQDEKVIVANELLLLNIMTEQEKNDIQALNIGTPDNLFHSAVDALFQETQKNAVGKNLISGPSLFKILSAASDTGGSGYVTLAFNNDKKYDQQCSQITLEVIKVDCDQLKTGSIVPMESKDVFDEKITFFHDGDFAGNSQNITFDWYYFDGIDEPAKPTQDTLTDSSWIKVSQDVSNYYTIGGSDDKILKDQWVTCRYRGYNRCKGPNQYSEFTKPRLYKNWIARVTEKINPFEQRYKDFHNTELATYVSMIQQAGDRYQGNIALNNAPDYLNSVGLIECYETLLNRAIRLTIEGTPAINDSNANNTLLSATSRIADLYMLLGNEAYGDACDPTIGLTTDNGNFSVAPSIYCFQGIAGSLLEEEMGLLRGLPSVLDLPPYHRLKWNFTGGNGTVAYVNNYGVSTIIEAMNIFPQGHGDAWGHYLTVLKKYYYLLKHQKFTWIPRTENKEFGGSSTQVDYYDEKKFAAAAAAKAKVGAEIVNLTYRDKYVDNPKGQWQGYKDTDSQRAWGLSEWAVRAGQGAYFDWVSANAILPEKDNNPDHSDLEQIDRSTIPELFEIPSHLNDIQGELDKADMGLNPLGIAKNTIPFDIDPLAIDKGKTHFEQIYDRAIVAINNAIVTYNHANTQTQLLRKHQDTVDDYDNNVKDRETDYKNRLIEIFGYPYEDCICDGCTYPTGYDGPDYYYYHYVDPSALMNIDPPETVSFDIEYKESMNVDSTGNLSKHDKKVTYHIAKDGFGMIKPGNWKGSRKAPGEIQQARSDLILTKARFDKTLIEYNNLIDRIEDEAQIIQLQSQVNAAQINILYETMNEQQHLNNLIKKARNRQMIYKSISRIGNIIAQAMSEGMPSVFGVIGGFSCGVIGDVTAPARSAIQLGSALRDELLTQLSDAEARKELDAQQAKEIVQNLNTIQIQTLQNDHIIQQKIYQLKDLIRNEATLRLELYGIQESIQQASGRYLAVLAKGERLFQERLRYRNRVADQIREYRYADMAFRIFRNDAIQKYRAQFDFAAMYVYLAAKAYDYDTCLLNSDSRAGEHFLTEIVKQRCIGKVESGLPVAGGIGLTNMMLEMSGNFESLKPETGFNNPQIETNPFSLRSEFFRIKAGYSSNKQWSNTLKEHLIDNLWDLREFRQYCRPFSNELQREPAIVIPFSTTITSRLNFFGKQLAGGDSYYDPSRFATKIRGVGLWFSNYDNTVLSETPRVYLIPAGEDIIGAAITNIRMFKVIDQVLPLPSSIGDSDLESSEWIPSINTVNDTFFKIRRNAGFLALHDGGTNWNNNLIRDSRLIGRSVWNTRWLLIIPGASLNFDPDKGLDDFINTISDIKFIFETYSYAGARK
jgi:hypothetical protein